MNPLKYLLYPPQGEATAPHPLIIFLHGVGERGEDLQLVKKYGLPHYLETGEVRLPAYVVVPQCPADRVWPEAEMLNALDDLLNELLVKHPIDADRVYLTGFSLGGFGTWAWGGARPERFAALMPVGGSGFSDGKHLAEVDLSILTDMPIWMVHGALDQAVPVIQADEIFKALLALGANLGYTRYPDATHGDTSDRAFADLVLYRWLLAQKRNEVQS